LHFCQVVFSLNLFPCIFNDVLIQAVSRIQYRETKCYDLKVVIIKQKFQREE
jgi:hypothetical protein